MSPTLKHSKPSVRRTVLSFGLALLCAPIAVPAHAATSGFAGKTDYATGSYPYSVTTGDFNGDGKLDLVVANSGSNTVSVLPGDGNGGFGAKTDFSTGAGPVSVITGDFNGDGKADLVVSNAGDSTVSVLLGDGGGGFGARTDYAAGLTSYSMTTGDFNGDGKLDLAAADTSFVGAVSVLLGNGSGGFGTKTDYATGSTPESVTTGDFNGDGKLDLATANANPGGSGSVSVLLGDGGGGFGAKTDYATGSTPESVTTGDFNGDGKLDLAVANRLGNTVSVLRGDGVGGFGARTDYATGSQPFSVVTDDFNGDGKLDLAVANYGASTVSVLLGDGSGLFGAKTDYATGLTPLPLTKGDFNGDGKPDLATANSQANGSVSVLLNNSDPAISIGDAVVTEGNTGTTDANFTVTLSSASSQTIAVHYATADGTAVAPGDYTATSGTLTFAPGETTKTITVPVIGDTLNEPDETFSVNIDLPATGPSNAIIVDAEGIGTIQNDDDFPILAIDDIAVTEGNTGTTNANFIANLSAASGQTVTVHYATADGTATAGSDYTATSGTLTFAPGETTKTITVPVIGDTLNEANETFSLDFDTPTNAVLANAQTTGTILDDDAMPSLSVGDATVTEGNTGTTNANFTVTLSAASGQPVTVAYATADGTAAAPGDYTATSGTVTFAPGETAKTITVPVLGDTAYEADETFTVGLDTPANATIAGAQGTGTILNDDDIPALSIGDASVTEGNAGTTGADFIVALSSPSSQTISVHYATVDGTAAAPGDYTATSGTLTFAPGETTKTITVPVIGDTLNEPDETFTVNLDTPANATLADATGTGTILNDDGVPAISIDDVALNEGDALVHGDANFAVTLSAPSAQPITVHYATADGTAVAPDDYTATSGTVTFAPGETTELIAVPITGDSVYEPDETFTVNLDTPTNATLADAQGIGTILNDDPEPYISINDATAQEGDSGTTNMDFNVTLLGTSSLPITVHYATADITATAGVDYVATSGTLTFAPGDTMRTISVPVIGDTLNEPNETFFVNLDSPTNASVADDQGIGTIKNDDALPALSINDVSQLEGNSGTSNAVFKVTLSSASGQTVTVHYATADGTATAGSDYTATSGTLTFAPGETLKAVAVAVTGDTAHEPDETYTVNLDSPVNATIADGQGVGTIKDDDNSILVVVNAKVVWPLTNSTVYGVTHFQARTADNLDGAGVERVDFYLLRNADSMWWNGKSWGKEATALPSVQSPTGTWTKTGGLPDAKSSDETTRLDDGVYTVYIRTTDINGKVSTFSSLFQQQTPIKVNASIVTPKKNSTINGLPGLQAKTTDSLGGTGVKSVDFYLMRNADSMWWNGTMWGKTAAALPSTQSPGGPTGPSGTWTKVGGLPMATSTDPAKKLSDGVYTVYIRPTDIHGVVSTFSSLFQQQSPIKVSASITVPKKNSTINGLPGLQAKTADSLGGSGVKSVDFYLLRNADSMWWNGTMWGKTATALPGVQSPMGTWTKVGGMPSSTSTDSTKKLTDGIYTVYIRPTDIHGAVTTFSSLFQQQTPIKVSASIVTPKRNGTVTSLPSIQAKTTDSLGGTGVKSVDFYLLRNSDSMWWSGSMWVKGPMALPATQSPNGPWTRMSGLPGPSDLTKSIYTVYIRTTDIHGVVSTFSSLFQVLAPATKSEGAPARDLPVSSASASAVDATITLNFATALDPVLAANPDAYSVTVDGVAIEPQSIGLQHAGRTVVIGLPGGTLHPGSTVNVGFHLGADAGETAVNAR